MAARLPRIVIRKLGPDDSIAEITALLHRAYGRLAAMGLNYTAVDQSEKVTRERAERGTCLVAVRDGRIVGTIACHPPDPASDAAWYRRPDVRILEQFAVEPDLQEQGLGRALMEAAEDLARRDGAAYAVGGTAIQARHLIDMYAAWGYEEVETHQIPGKRYRTVVLAKRL